MYSCLSADRRSGHFFMVVVVVGTPVVVVVVPGAVVVTGTLVVVVCVAEVVVDGWADVPSCITWSSWEPTTMLPVLCSEEVFSVTV